MKHELIYIESLCMYRCEVGQVYKIILISFHRRNLTASDNVHGYMYAKRRHATMVSPPAPASDMIRMPDSMHVQVPLQGLVN
jgi:hypothetical protein